MYNEAETIAHQLLYLENTISKNIPYEIIVVDGGSKDGSLYKITPTKTIFTTIAPKGRAKQMNAGAKMATGDVLYFLHCDSLPTKHFDLDIENQIKNGNHAGCFRMKFDYNHPLLIISQWFTRFNYKSCRGGDQSLFITRNLFEEIGGFKEEYTIYEDNELIERLYQKNKFVVIQKAITTSARKYVKNGVLRLQYHFAIIHLKRKLGHSAENLHSYYKKHVF